MASPVKALGWSIAAAAAFAFLIGLAMHGKRPDGGLSAYRSAGYFKQFEPQDASEVTITSRVGTKTLVRNGSWPSGTDEALKLLRDSAPMRVMTEEEVAGQPPAAYGFDNPLTVAVRAGSGQLFTIRFGATNPLGSGSYVKVDGVAGVPILPSHVAEAWERLAQ